MKRVLQVSLGLALALLLVSPANAQAGDPAPSQGVDVERNMRDIPIGDPDPFVPLPAPLTMNFTSDRMQLVGFTLKTVAANAGVLNMSLVCQQEFRHSRMCTADEIRRSLVIPDPEAGLAWVQDLSPNATLTMNCNSWMSNSEKDFGTVVALAGDCFGGLKPQTCDSYQSIACCAKQGTTLIR